MEEENGEGHVPWTEEELQDVFGFEEPAGDDEDDDLDIMETEKEDGERGFLAQFKEHLGAEPSTRKRYTGNSARTQRRRRLEALQAADGNHSILDFFAFQKQRVERSRVVGEEEEELEPGEYISGQTVLGVERRRAQAREPLSQTQAEYGLTLLQSVVFEIPNKRRESNLVKSNACTKQTHVEIEFWMQMGSPKSWASSEYWKREVCGQLAV